MPSYVRGRPRAGRLISDAEIVELYAAGTDSMVIGIQAGCSDTTVRDLVRAAGGAVRARGGKPRRVLALPDAEIVRLYKSGMGGVEIADRAGCTPNTIYAILRNSGVALRASFEKAAAERRARRRNSASP
jgi:DNA-binding CsgD family transcriptional regulator